MASIAGVVVPGAWHHATQRGNHQQMVFLADADRVFFLGLLWHYTFTDSLLCSPSGVESLLPRAQQNESGRLF